MVLKEEELNKISVYDLYIEDAFDTAIRGYNNQYNETIWLEENNDIALAMENQKNEILKETEKLNDKKKTDLSTAITPKEPLEINATGSFSRNNMVNYALNNCSLNQPARGNSSIPYYDFSSISGNFDCTNFASHVLLSGGTPVRDTNDPNTGWYYFSLSDRSYSWSGVRPFYNFVTGNTAKGPYGTGLSYFELEYPSYAGYQKGDIIQIQYSASQGYRHTVIVTDFYLYQGYGVKEPKITSRTADDNYNKNRLISSAYPGYTKRILRLDGYRY